MTESARTRQEFIEFRAVWEGAVNRSDLTGQFGISVPQASNDLRTYLERNPGVLAYDTKSKRYRASPLVKPSLFPFEATRFFHELRRLKRQEPSWLGRSLPVAEPPVLGRRVEPETAQLIARAIHERRTVSLQYQTSIEPAPKTFQIEPHAFASDGFRWHTRAFSLRDMKFSDFVLSRISGISMAGMAQHNPEDDALWLRDIAVVLRANRNLKLPSRRAVETEYGMTSGKLAINVKVALLKYFLTEHRLDFDPDEKAERAVHRLEVVNVDEVSAALTDADFIVTRLGRGLHATAKH